MSLPIPVLAILVFAPLVLLLAYFVLVFNRLVVRRNECANARSSIDVNLTRRHDLIPGLVKAIRGYTEHERRTLEDVTEARLRAVDQLGAEGSAAAERQVDDSLATMIAVTENYPDLKADSLFRQLMRNLTEAEEQISASRRAFNGQVLRLNNLVQQFPTLIVANMMGFRTLSPYSAAAAERSVPSAKLGPEPS